MPEQTNCPDSKDEKKKKERKPPAREITIVFKKTFNLASRFTIVVYIN